MLICFIFSEYLLFTVLSTYCKTKKFNCFIILRCQNGKLFDLFCVFVYLVTIENVLCCLYKLKILCKN